MFTRELANRTIEFEDNGHLKNPADWSVELAQALAEDYELVLTEQHWKVIEFARQEFKEKGEPPTIRRITTSGTITTKELYELFPDGPASKVAKIAGLRKPTGCI